MPEQEEKAVRPQMLNGAGMFVLHYLHVFVSGIKSRRMLSAILRDESKAFIASKILEDKLAEHGVGFASDWTWVDLVKWLIENPQILVEFIQALMVIFNPPTPIPPIPDPEPEPE